jgi:hypothetical protein
MAVKLDQVVPFGRSLDEYIHMFGLTPHDLQGSILSVADGPASFNAEGTRLGYRIRSLDPLYCFSAEQILSRFNQAIDPIMEQIQQTPDDWVWDYHSSLEQLRQRREQTIQLFCQDYAIGQAEGRYQVGSLPLLPYPAQTFQLGLSSHFLFLYSDHFDCAFHLDSILEMLRVCQEVRIFPLLTLMRHLSPHLETVLAELVKRGYTAEICTVAYELQRGGNQMLKIKPR